MHRPKSIQCILNPQVIYVIYFFLIYNFNIMHMSFNIIFKISLLMLLLWSFTFYQLISELWRYKL